MSRNALALRGYRACFLALALLAANGRSSTAFEQAPASVRTGTVLIDGQLIDGPYVVAAAGSEVTVNGLPVGHIPTKAVSGFPFADDPAHAAIADVERLLLQDGLLLRHGQTALLLPGLEGRDGGALLADVVCTLTSTSSAESKLRMLATYSSKATRHMTTQRWLELIELFETNKELAAQVISRCSVVVVDPAMDIALNDAIGAEESDISVRPATEPVDISETVQYGVNLFGMLAGVVALGSLLSSRPETDRRWRELNGSAAGMKLVARCGGLIILLGLFDLVCTVMAIQTGMFRELNPIASQLSASPLMIVVFKLVAMGLGVGLLWRLRQYSGAQTAAWWMCLICTLVVFRWLTFQSMFIA